MKYMFVSGLIQIGLTMHCMAQIDPVVPEFLTASIATNYYPVFASKPATAYERQVRPFITDDSRVVGDHLAQLESWVRIDKHDLENWILAAYGPTDKLELTFGGVWGIQKTEEGRNFTYALPLLQAKFLFKEYAPGKPPGLGAVVGTFLPFGSGEAKPQGYGSFGFLTMTQSFGEGDQVLLHLNGGGNYLHVAGENQLIGTWGFGAQVHTLHGFHLVGEIFSGDPYVPGSGISYQVGFRHFISDLLQIDMTYGRGIAGDNILDPWVSAGVRIVFEHFLQKEVNR